MTPSEYRTGVYLELFSSEMPVQAATIRKAIDDGDFSLLLCLSKQIRSRGGIAEKARGGAGRGLLRVGTKRDKEIEMELEGPSISSSRTTRAMLSTIFPTR
jgi:hypothetical protein